MTAASTPSTTREPAAHIRPNYARSGRRTEPGQVTRHNRTVTDYRASFDAHEAHKGTRGAPRTDGRHLRVVAWWKSATGADLDAPFHRFADGGDLTSVRLEQCVDLPAVVVRVAGAESVAVDGSVTGLDVRGAAVLLYTGDAARFGTPGYAEERHYLTGAAAGIAVVEHLTGLEQLPPRGRSSLRSRCASPNSGPFPCARSPASRTERPAAGNRSAPRLDGAPVIG